MITKDSMQHQDILPLISPTICESTNMDDHISKVTLSPGEFYFGDANTTIYTLLGSCIAITLWHPSKLIGGMCHYLLPARGENKQLSYGHFADDALELFMKHLKLTESSPEEYEVKLFGGGNMFACLQHPNLGINIAEKNIAAGIDLLVYHGFKIKKTDVGGCQYRKIHLELNTGDVWVKHGKLPLDEEGMQDV
jgi:chemotaxis protein CheD